VDVVAAERAVVCGELGLDPPAAAYNASTPHCNRPAA
jgi:hypothetical protein